MTVSLVRPEPIDLDAFDGRDFLIVVRRYDVSSAPWGLHVLHVDFATTPQISHRTIGLFDTPTLIATVRHHGLRRYGLVLEKYVDEGVDVLAMLAAAVVDDYIWTQVVPMEWHGKRDDLHPRVQLLNLFGNWDYYDDYYWRQEWREELLGWDVRPVIDVELPA